MGLRLSQGEPGGRVLRVQRQLQAELVPGRDPVLIPRKHLPQGVVQARAVWTHGNSLLQRDCSILEASELNLAHRQTLVEIASPRLDLGALAVVMLGQIEAMKLKSGRPRQRQ